VLRVAGKPHIKRHVFWWVYWDQDVPEFLVELAESWVARMQTQEAVAALSSAKGTQG
jgi:hypothetical protein